LRCGYEDVLGLNVAVEELACVNVLQSCEDLEEDALDAVGVQRLVVSGLHQLVQVSIHVLHGNVKPPAVWVQEDVQSRYEVRVRG
jgi:hypothetical protein